jgi:hypothetical protein
MVHHLLLRSGAETIMYRPATAASRAPGERVDDPRARGKDRHAAATPASPRIPGVRPTPALRPLRTSARRSAQFHPAWWLFWRAGQDETGHSYVIVVSTIS